MNRQVSMQFGKPSATSQNRNGAASDVIYSGKIEDEAEAILSLDPGGLYELFTAEYNASTGAYRGHRLVIIKAPEGELFGTVACAHGNAYASTNSGVTIGYPTDSTVTIKRSSATYAVTYVLKAVKKGI